MKLEHDIILPSKFRETVKDYLKVLIENKEYPAYTINDDLEIIECKGVISNNGSWNYHNNYDDSENELYVIIDGRRINKWFSINREDVEKVQAENIIQWNLKLADEINRVNKLNK